jgi:D-aspartate ligase
MQGLQLARLLADRGVPVYAVASDPGYHTCRTRVCEEIVYTDTGGEELVDTLEVLGRKFTTKPVLFPCQDKNVLVVSRNRDRLARWYRVVLPDPDIVEMMTDKVQFYAYARDRDFRIPATFILRDRRDAERAADALSYPCLLKPPRGVAGWTKQTREKALRAEDAAALLSLYDRCRGWTEVLVAQQWIEGSDADLFSCNAYFGEGAEPLVTFVARKTRQWPPRTGKSASGEECRQDEVLAESIRLFRNVGLRGLGYLEFKRDSRTGEFFIIEPNIGRPTGRSAIAEAGGVELHYTMYCDAAGLPLPKSRNQRYVGAKWINVLRDLQSSFYYWRRDELTPREWLRSVRGRKAYAILSWRDPAPFLAALATGIASSVPGRDRRAPVHQVDSTP